MLVCLIPLVHDTTLKMSKLYTVPWLNNDLATFIKLEKDFIMSDINNEKYITKSRTDLMNDCTRVENKYYCNKLGVLKKDVNTCEIKMLTQNLRNIQQICSVNVLRIQEIIFIETENENSFIIIFLFL